MKHLFLLIAALFAFLSAFSVVPSAPITQERADEIVLERMNQDVFPYGLSAKENVQTKMVITTSAGGELELDYRCWVYYAISYHGMIDTGRYLIVNESNGNLLEVKAHGSNARPRDLAEWRVVEPKETDLEIGTYAEALVSPYNTEIVFLDEENLIMRGKYWSKGDIYCEYEIHDNTIKLTSEDFPTSWEIYFRILNNRRFEIAYLYPYFTMGPPPPPMIFTKTEDIISFSEAKMTNSVNLFSMEFFATAHEELKTDENIVLSPLSLNMALAMVWNGAKDDTRRGIQQAMGMQNYAQEDVNNYFLDLRNKLTTADSNVKLALANSIWYHNDFPVKTDFINVNKDYYDAEVNEIDFRAPDAPDQINEWCSDNTNGLIKTMIDKIPGSTVMYLINALYFKGMWKEDCGFDPERTYQTYFHKENGENVSVEMMTQKRKDIDYYSDDHLQMVTLPYGNGAYCMVFVLPEGDFSEMLQQLKQPDYWQNCLSELKSQEVSLTIPKFKVEYASFLNDILTILGIEKAFTSVADFSGISDISLLISQVRQKTYIEVDEKGTEAAAVTTIEMPTSSYPPKPVFFADRPFLFVIQENTTGTMLFMGKIGNP